MSEIGQTEDKRARHRGLALLISLVIAFGVSGIGAAVTRPSISTWYAQLNKPAFAPPNWVFAPAWTILYAMMALAVWLVWLCRDKDLARARVAFCFYGVQLALNLLWSVLFFGWHDIALAGLDILLLLAAIAVTIFAFRRLSPVAGWLLIPYVAWVSYAAALNLGFWYLN